MNPTPLYSPPRFPRFFRSKPGEISEGRCWCCSHGGYLYIGTSLLNLIWIFITEFQNDKHLVG